MAEESEIRRNAAVFLARLLDANSPVSLPRYTEGQLATVAVKLAIELDSKLTENGVE